MGKAKGGFPAIRTPTSLHRGRAAIMPQKMTGVVVSTGMNRTVSGCHTVHACCVPVLCGCVARSAGVVVASLSWSLPRSCFASLRLPPVSPPPCGARADVAAAVGWPACFTSLRAATRRPYLRCRRCRSRSPERSPLRCSAPRYAALLRPAPRRAAPRCTWFAGRACTTRPPARLPAALAVSPSRLRCLWKPFRATPSTTKSSGTRRSTCRTTITRSAASVTGCRSSTLAASASERYAATADRPVCPVSASPLLGARGTPRAILITRWNPPRRWLPAVARSRE